MSQYFFCIFPNMVNGTDGNMGVVVRLPVALQKRLSNVWWPYSKQRNAKAAKNIAAVCGSVQ